MHANNIASEMRFGLSDGGEDGEHNGIGLVKISITFSVQNDFCLSYGTIRQS